MTATAFWVAFALPAVAAVFRPWIGVVAYAAFAVLGPDSTYSHVVDGALSTQKMLAGCTIVGALLAGFRGQRMTFVGGLAVASLGGFLAVAFWSTWQSMFPEKSWWCWDHLWKIGVMVAIAVRTLDRPHRISALVWAIVLAQTYNAFWVNLEYYRVGYSETRVNGRHGLDNNTYALSTMPTLAFAAALAVHRSPWALRILAAVCFALQLHQAILLDSRGALVSLIVLFLVGAAFMPKRADTIVGAAAALALGIALSGPMVVKRFQTIYVAEEKRDESADSRFELWNAGWRIMLDYPFTGVGLFAGERMVPKYSRYSKDKDKALHNLFFDVGTGTGFLGVGLYLGFFGCSWLAAYSAWRKLRAAPWAWPATLGALAGVAAYWAGSMFSSSMLIESAYLQCVVAVAAAAVVQRQIRRAAWEREQAAPPP